MKGRFGLGGLILGVGLTLIGCGGERQQQPYLIAEPVVQEPNRDSIRTEIRNAIRQRGHVVQPKETWAGIAGENFVGYGSKFDGGEGNSKEMGRVLQDTNFTLERCGYVSELVQVYDPISGSRYEMVRYRALRTGDTLVMPEVLGGQWFFDPSGIEDSVDNRIKKAEESREADAAYAKWYFDTHL